MSKFLSNLLLVWLACGILVVVVVLVLPSCPTPGYHGYFTNVTRYTIKPTTATPRGIVVAGTSDASLLAVVDLKVDQVEECLVKQKVVVRVNRKWFGVHIPPDWYVSSCSGEQLIPSVVDYRLCEAKGLVIPTACHTVSKPTPSCPCICNMRSVIQDDFWIITTPNLKLFKAELIRLVSNTNNVWIDKRLQPCLL